MDIKTRKQTTKGIELEIIDRDNINLIILDIEGADSRERWENKDRFQSAFCSFGLIVSDFLIVNLWTQDVGRFDGSNYGLIK